MTLKSLQRIPLRLFTITLGILLIVSFGTQRDVHVAAAGVAAQIQATLNDNLPGNPAQLNLVNDVDADGKADPGDTLRYTSVLTNSGSADAANVQLADTLPLGAVLVPNSIKVSPIAFDDTAQVDPLNSINIDVLANDTDAGTALNPASAVVTIVTAPTNGTATPIAGTGQVTYTNTNGAATLDSFTYRVTDQDGMPSNETATVTVTVGTAAQGVDDAYNVVINGTLNVPAPGLLGNDLGTPTLTVSAVNGSAGNVGTSITVGGGTLTVNSDGSFSYTAPPSPGPVTFTYTASNAQGTSDATVTLNVYRPPDAKDDSLTMLVTGTLNGNLGNDNGSGADDPGSPAYDQLTFGGGSLGGAVTDHAAGAAAALAGGTLTVNADSSFSLLNPTITGTYTFQYRLTSSIPVSDDATVTITVQQAPNAAADGTYFVATGTTLTITTAAANDLLDNDTLGFPAATLTSFGGGSLGGVVTDHAAGASVSLAGGTLTVNGDGSFSLVNPTTAGTVTFDYRLTNAANTSDATVTITVQDAPLANDDAPAANSAPGDNYHTDVNTTLGPSAYSVLANDSGTALAVASFGPSSGTETAAGSGGTTAQGGTLTVSAAGTFTYAPPLNFVGYDTFVYTASNSVGSDTATVTIAVGIRPQAVDDSYGVVANGTLTVNAPGVLSNDTASPTLTVSAVNGSAANVGAPTAVGGGTLTLNADGSFTYAAPSATGPVTFTYTAQNPLDTSTATVTITVAAAPVANADGPAGNSVPGDNYHTAINTAITGPTAYSVLDNDSGVTPLSVVSYGASAATPGNAAATTQGGSVTLNATGKITLYTPPSATFAGLDTFDYTMTSSLGGSATATVTIAVGIRPDAIDDSYTVIASGTLTVGAPGVLSNDTGSPTLTVSAVNGSAGNVGNPIAVGGGTLTLNADGSFTYAAPPATGPVTFTYTLQNGLGTATATVTISVVAPPVANADGPTSTSAPGDPYHTAVNTPISGPTAYSVLANDTGSAPLSVTSYGASAAIPGNPAATTQGGSVTLNAAGNITTYTPPNASFVGLDTFSYSMTSSLGGSATATVTIAVGIRANAVDDSYAVIASGTLTIPAPGVLSNDTGSPTLTVSAVNGSAGNVGVAITVGGGTLTLNADGSFSYTAPAATGPVTFTYTPQNPLGADPNPATVTITVVAPPVANADGPVSNSAPGDNYHTALNTAITGPTAYSLLANDTGSAPLSVTSYGASAATPGNAAATIQGGSVTLNGAGNITHYTPPSATFVGLDTFTYSMTSSVGGSATATVTMAVGVRPSAVADTYTITGNIAINVPLANGTMSNDLGDQINVTQVNGVAGNVGTFINTTQTGLGGVQGRVKLNADGSLQYDPPPGYTSGTDDSFTYIVHNGFGDSASATVTLHITNMVWFICHACASSNQGTLLQPFTSMNAFDAVNTGVLATNQPQTGDRIYIESGTYSGGSDNLTLRDNQSVAGQGIAATTFFTVPTSFTDGAYAALTAGSKPVLAPTAGNGITLGTGNTVQALDVTTTSGIGIAGTNATVNATSVTNTATVNADVAVTSSGADGFALGAGNGTISFGASVTNTGGHSISIQNRTGGTVTLSGAISDTATGILVNSNAGATIDFTGGLNISTGANSAFTATGGGTVNATQNNTSIVNTLTTTTATALNVANTTIGASGLTFRRISSNGAPSGIVLNHTGTTGGLTVSGNGSASSGGTIQNSSGDGVVLGDPSANPPFPAPSVPNRGTDSPNLNWMHITISGANGINMTNVTGAVALANDIISSSTKQGIFIDNFNTDFVSLTMTASTLTGSTGADGLLMQMRGSSVLATGSLTNVTFSGNASYGLDLVGDDNGVIGNSVGSLPNGAVTISGSTFTNNGGVGVSFASGGGNGSSSAMYVRFVNNTLTGTHSHAINVVSGATATGGAQKVLIDSNHIGTSGVPTSGSQIGEGIQVTQQGKVTQTVTITNNVIRALDNAASGPASFDARGIDVQMLGPTATGLAATAGDYTIVGNDVDQQFTGTATFIQYAIYVGADDQGSPTTLHAAIHGNTVPTTNPCDTQCGAPQGMIEFEQVTAPSTGTLYNFSGSGASVSSEIANTNTGTAGQTTSPNTGLSLTGTAPNIVAFNIAPSGTEMVALIGDATGKLATTQQVAAYADLKPAAVPVMLKHPVGSPAASLGSFPVSIGTLPVGKSVTIIYDVVIANPFPAGPDQISSQGTVTYDDGITTGVTTLTDDPNVVGLSDPTVTPIDAQIALTLAKSDGGASVVPGNSVTYSLTYGNTGNQSASGVALTETVPANTTVDPNSVTAGWVCVPDTNPGATCTFAIGGLAGGSSGLTQDFILDLPASVSDSVTQISNNASINDDGTSGESGLATASDTTPVTAAPVLSTQKTVADDNGGLLLPGDTLTYTVVIHNTGNRDAANAAFSDPIPADTTYVAESTTLNSAAQTDAADGDATTFNGAAIQVTLGTLPALTGTATVTFQVTVVTPYPASDSLTVSNQGTVSASNAPSAQTDDPALPGTSDPTDIDVIAGLTIQKAFLNTALQVHQTTTLRFTLINPNGSPALTNLSFTDDLPAGLNYVAPAVTPQCGGTVTLVDADSLSFSGGQLAAGASQCTIDVAVTATGSATGVLVNQSSAITSAEAVNSRSGARATVAVATPGSSGGGGSSTPAIPAENFLCLNLATQTNGAMTGQGGFGNVGLSSPFGNSYCHVLNLDGQYLPDTLTGSAQLGELSLIQLGVVQAIDVFGLMPGGFSETHFSSPVGICLRGSGSVYFISSVDHSVSLLPAVQEGGYLCVTVSEAGKVVLVGTPNPTAPLPPDTGSPSGAAVPVSQCQVTTTNAPLNLRAEPNTSSAVLAQLPYNVILTATEYQAGAPGWYRVIYLDMQGWVREDFLHTLGTCPS